MNPIFLKQNEITELAYHAGQLSPAVINLIHDAHLQKSIPIVFQVLFSPATNLTDIFADPTRSETVFANGPLLTLASLKKFIPDYVPSAKDRESILASPVLMNKTQAARQPPTMVIVGDADILRTEGEQFAKLLQQSGVKCGLVKAEAQVHDSAVWEETRKGPTAHALVLMAAALFNEALMPVDVGKKRKSEYEEEKENGEVQHVVKAHAHSERHKKRARR